MDLDVNQKYVTYIALITTKKSLGYKIYIILNYS